MLFSEAHYYRRLSRWCSISTVDKRGWRRDAISHVNPSILIVWKCCGVEVQLSIRNWKYNNKLYLSKIVEYMYLVTFQSLSSFGL